MEAEWIDLPTASVDGVLCRWGYMLLADPEAALRETRRVLRPGGRVALAAWGPPAANRWSSMLGEVLREHGLAEAPDPGEPGMFSFADPAVVEELLGGTGFGEIRVEELAVAFEPPSAEAWWEHQLDVSPSLAEALAGARPDARDAVRAAVGERLAEFARPDGSLRLPGLALVAAAEA